MNYSTSIMRVPGYLAYSSPVEPGEIPVPNQAQCFWPQGQLAPEYLPPGSRSYHTFVYPDFQPSEWIEGSDERDFGAVEDEPPRWKRTVATVIAGTTLIWLLWTRPWEQKPTDYDEE
jgi:hypothetical protein